MIVNRYPGKCQSCGTKLAQGVGFAYKNGYRWFSVCASAACHRKLGLTPPVPEAKQERKLTEDGYVSMPYDRDAIDLLRSLPGGRWDPTSKRWTCSLTPANLPRVIEIADTLKLDVPQILRDKLAEGTPESREALARAERRRYDGKPLYPFQKKGVEFLALHDHALLADVPGLGKTIQALLALPENQRVLIICPACVKYNWRDEAQMWRPDYKVSICNGRSSFVLPEPGEIILINYDILPAWLIPNKDTKKISITPEQTLALKETTLIADECHYAKNYKAIRSVKVKELSRLCHKVWFLSGTPLMNRPTDLYGILQSGSMNVLGNWNKFVSLFNGYKNPFGGYVFGMPNPEVPEKMKRVMLRRLKEEVLPDLPAKTYQSIRVNEMSLALKTQLNKMALQAATNQGVEVTKEEDIDSVVADLDASSLPAFSAFSAIRAKLAESRIPAMLEIVESYEDAETPLVVFSAHRKPIDELSRREGWAVITGDTKAEDRRDIVHAFQSGALKGIGLTIQAGGVGITLTRASNVLFVDLDWTPAANIQAEDRLLRIGQESNVLVMRMSSTHPLDVHMQELIELKIALAYKALEACVKFTPIKPRPLAQEIKIIEETDEELMARIAAAGAEADRGYFLGRIQQIAGREAAKVNNVPEPPLTPKRKEMLRGALAYMVSVCDGAWEKDFQGFNRPDAGIGHWIASSGLRDEDEVTFRVLERILVRYRRQLKGEFEAIWKPE